MTSNKIIDYELNCPHCGEYNELGSIPDGEVEYVDKGNIRYTKSYWNCTHCGKRIFPRLNDIRR